MLFLLFQLGEDRYALETGPVVEVLPLVQVQHVPRAPAGVAGVLNYHGMPVPVLDLGVLTLEKPSRARMSTRIILVKCVEETGNEHLLGLLAEQTTDTLRRAETDFVEAGSAGVAAPYLGPVTTDAKGVIYRVELKSLLSARGRNQLLRNPSEFRS